MTGDDASLLLDYARRGDVRSLSALVSRSERWLMSYLRGSAPSDADAEDAFQECWMRVIRSARSYRGGSVRSYLIRVARNVMIDRYRRRDPANVSIDDETASDLAASLESAGPTPAESLETTLSSEEIRREVRLLPEGPREVLLMRIEGELSFREIAEQMGIPLGTALTWMRSATIRLRKKLGGTA